MCMETKTKIGLVTIYQVPNYGSVLQAYATQRVIDDMGYECVMINYRYPNKWHYSIDSSRRQKVLRKLVCLLGLKPQHRKMRKLERFRRKYFHFSKKFNDFRSLDEENWDDYGAFVFGSDQVWNTRFTLGDPVFLLAFLPDSIHRVSYASSFASASLDEKYVDEYKRHLGLFDVISVREDNGKTLIRRDLGLDKDIKVVLDPTLLLDKNAWLSMFSRKRVRGKRKKYLLVYLLTYAFESRPYVYQVIRFFQQKYGYEVVALGGYAPPSKALGIEMHDKTDSGVDDFIRLFANAEMVITTSFHGTAFAINFEKPLISIVPESREDDRQRTLLESLGLQQCVTPVSTPLEKINPFYGQDAIIKLSELRKASLAWLSEALA